LALDLIVGFHWFKMVLKKTLTRLPKRMHEKHSESKAKQLFTDLHMVRWQNSALVDQEHYPNIFLKWWNGRIAQHTLCWDRNKRQLIFYQKQSE
jgi:hypothetical protein